MNKKGDHIIRSLVDYFAKERFVNSFNKERILGLSNYTVTQKGILIIEPDNAGRTSYAHQKNYDRLRRILKGVPIWVTPSEVDMDIILSGVLEDHDPDRGIYQSSSAILPKVVIHDNEIYDRKRFKTKEVSDNFKHLLRTTRTWVPQMLTEPRLYMAYALGYFDEKVYQVPEPKRADYFA